MLVSCQESSNSQQTSFTDSPSEGTIYISVDEAFKPVIQEQIKVYQSSYPKAKIVASYKPEVECFKDLQKDSTRMVIVARGLNKEEQKYYRSNLGYDAVFGVLAYDAVAVIVNKQSSDSIYTVKSIQNLLSGKVLDKTLVMDGNNATSTVRYLMDTLMKGTAFGKNVVAAKSSKEVIEFVANNVNAVGFVGLAWIGDPLDKQQIEWRKKVDFALMECTLCPKKGEIFAKPSQATIQGGEYPFRRGIYYILKENRTGLGSGFLNFLSHERGQLIFRRSYLAPAKMVFQERTTLLNESTTL